MPADHAGDCRRVTHVAGVDVDLDSFGAQLLRRRVEHLLLAAGDGDSGAVVAEHPADLLADAGRAAGDEGDLSGNEIGPKRRRRRGSQRSGHLAPPQVAGAGLDDSLDALERGTHPVDVGTPAQIDP